MDIKRIISSTMLVFSFAVFAEDNGPNYFSSMISYTAPDSDRDAEYGGGGHFLFGQPIGPRWALEYGFFASIITHDSDEEHDNQYSLGLDFAYAWNRGGLSPFLLAGGGAIYDDVRREEVTSPFANIGAGLVIPIHEGGAGIRAEARYVADINDESVAGEDVLGDVRANIGLQIPFNKTIAAASPPPPAPPLPIPLPAPRDFDKDGVLDDVDQCPNTKPGVPVGPRGCDLDDDNDGVANYRDKCPNTPAEVQVDENGCPRDSDNDGCLDVNDMCPDTLEGLNVDRQGCALPQFTVLEGVNFEFDSDQLTANAMSILDLVVKTLRGQPDIRVSVDGHTDSKGSDAYNLRLSRERAASVEFYLESQGINGSRLRSQGFGETRPVATNDTAAGREQNRRVELEVIK